MRKFNPLSINISKFNTSVVGDWKKKNPKKQQMYIIIGLRSVPMNVLIQSRQSWSTCQKYIHTLQKIEGGNEEFTNDIRHKGVLWTNDANAMEKERNLDEVREAKILGV